MKTHVIYAHPNPKSFSSAILETTKLNLSHMGHEFVISDLYKQDFNPVLGGKDFEAMQKGDYLKDVKSEQEKIAGAKTIVLIYPIWWTGMPAILKGYIDRVFSYGFAYKFGKNGLEKLLSDKQAIIFNTMGQPKDYYDSIGMTEALKNTSDVGIYEFCGIKTLEHKFFDSVPSSDEVRRKGYLIEVQEILKKYL